MYGNYLQHQLSDNELEMLERVETVPIRVSTYKEELIAQKLFAYGFLKDVSTTADWVTGQMTYIITEAGRKYLINTREIS